VAGVAMGFGCVGVTGWRAPSPSHRFAAGPFLSRRERGKKKKKKNGAVAVVSLGVQRSAGSGSRRACGAERRGGCHANAAMMSSISRATDSIS
jgi:hypothetical protein